ncbi:hypothetical protein BDN70DRAFT_880596 [Pholiota conissans]|uniref:Uncharacterized protein n=1 Tax=Pholiota conissans TaxID=109636 RepID=A0A9P6CZQ1_9AGAR|nr:hypothetical protein BDN70DRAFT_880596 [Pholiota conissans]
MVVFSWIAISASNLILVGKQTGPQPGRALCFTQALLEYALPPYAVACVAAFMLDVSAPFLLL